MAEQRHSRQDLQALARQEARNAGIPESLFLALIEQESNWNPRAVGDEGKAHGLGQLHADAAKDTGVKDRMDPAQNLRGAATYLKRQIDRFGDLGLALAAYNWGPGKVNGMLENPARFTPPVTTQKYVTNIFGNAANYGEAPAPSTPTLAFFPGVTDAAKKVVNTGVKARTGQADVRRVENLIQTGQTPRPQPAPVAGMEPPPPPAGLPPSAGATPEEAAAVASASIMPTLGAKPPPESGESMSKFLKRHFGPVADFADPFPKAYDAQLMRMIDEA